MTPSVEGGICKQCGEPEMGPDGNGNNALPPGTLLGGGRVVVGKKLGSGGFGVTYIAYDKERQRRVALKEFMPNYLADRHGKQIIPRAGMEQQYERSMKSFQKEARALYELRAHPNIVHVLATFKENGTAFYTMDLLNGISLLEYVNKKGKMSAWDAYKLLAPIIDAIGYVHSKKILHRDISPDNIMICTDPSQPNTLKPMLIDFGAAHVAIQGYSLSYPGVKKKHMSPIEQNWDGKYQGPWTDVYSFCATFYSILVGKQPTAAADRAEADRDPLQPPSALGADISPEVEAVLMKGMAIKYQDRIQSMGELHREMDRAFNREIDRKGEGITKAETGVDIHMPDTSGNRPIGRRIGAWFLEHGLIWAIEVIMLFALIGYSPFYYFSPASFLFRIPWLTFGSPLFIWILDIILMMSTGATLGQLICGLQATKDDGGGNPGFGSSLVYAFFYASYGSIVGLICGIVWLASGKDVGPLERLVGIHIDLRNKHTSYAAPAYVYMPSRSQKSSSAGTHTPAAKPQRQPSQEQKPVQQTPVPANLERAVLQCRHAGQTVEGFKGKLITVHEGDTMGKSSAKAKIVVPDATVSGLHCSFSYSKSRGWMIRDEDSRNGTYVNDKRLPPMGYAPLHTGTVIRIGQEEFVFKA